MFLVFNKEKIYAYLVSILTVCLLFFIASTSAPKDVETSTKAEISNTDMTNSNTETNTLEEKTNSKEQECSLVPNDETNSVDTSGNL